MNKKQRTLVERIIKKESVQKKVDDLVKETKKQVKEDNKNTKAGKTVK